MDNSKERIEMCEKAEEIQKLWKPKYGDCYVWAERCIRRERAKRSNPYCIVRYFDEETQLIHGMTGANERRHVGHCVWLPLQHQLQAMFPHNAYEMMAEFYTWAYGQGEEPRMSKFNSWEQLWFAFMMSELHKKVWDFEKKEWIKEEQKG